MRTIHVHLSDATLADLVERATRERRHPRDQATILIEQGLHRDSNRPVHNATDGREADHAADR